MKIINRFLNRNKIRKSNLDRSSLTLIHKDYYYYYNKHINDGKFKDW